MRLSCKQSAFFVDKLQYRSKLIFSKIVAIGVLSPTCTCAWLIKVLLPTLSIDWYTVYIDTMITILPLIEP